MNGDINRNVPTGYRRPSQDDDELIGMEPLFPRLLVPWAALSNREGLNPWRSLEERLMAGHSALASFPAASRLPVRITFLGNDVTTDRTPRHRQTNLGAPTQFVSLSETAATVPESSLLTQEDQQNAVKELRKEIYNPIPKKIIQRLSLYYRDSARGKEKEADYGDDKRCTVCLEDFEPKQVVTVTPCEHMFHEDCIVPWVKSHGQCPVCRFSIARRRADRDSQQGADAGFENTPSYYPLTRVYSAIRAMEEGRVQSNRGPSGYIWF